MRRRFVTLDVFTNRRFAGNPLAVVLDAERLDTGQRRQLRTSSITRRLCSSFRLAIPLPGGPHSYLYAAPRAAVCRSSDGRHGGAARPAQCAGAVRASEIVLEEGIGPVRCTLETAANAGGRASFTIPQLQAEVEPVPDDAIIAMALGLAAADFGEFRPARWSAGMPFTFVPLTSRAAVERCRPDLVSFDSAFGAGGAAYVVCRQTVEPGHSFHARMFAPGMGVPENAATGSAAAAFAGLLTLRTCPTEHIPSPSSRAMRWDGRA